jgi:hypothetical protein
VGAETVSLGGIRQEFSSTCGATFRLLRGAVASPSPTGHEAPRGPLEPTPASRAARRP